MSAACAIPATNTAAKPANANLDVCIAPPDATYAICKTLDPSDDKSVNVASHSGDLDAAYVLSGDNPDLQKHYAPYRVSVGIPPFT
jgi:hypothetical protein